MACLSCCIITMIALAQPFSTVYFQVYPQSAWPWRCIITLVTFIWLFSTVYFQMCPQIACISGYIIALVAFVWPFSTMWFQMSYQTPCPRWCIVTLIASLGLFLFVNLYIGIFHSLNFIVGTLIHPFKVPCISLVRNWDTFNYANYALIWMIDIESESYHNINIYSLSPCSNMATLQFPMHYAKVVKRGFEVFNFYR